MRFARRLLNVLRPGRAEPDLAREIASHLALLEEEFQRRGMSAADARRSARLTLGGIEQTKERHRDARSLLWLDDARRDLQYAVRSLRRAPGFAFVAIVTLALGIGANTAIFSLIDALLLRWLPVRNPQELVALTRIELGGQSGANFSYPQVLRLADQHGGLLSGLCGYSEGTLNVGRSDSLEQIEGAWVSGGYFETLGLTPAAGRLLTIDDDRAGAAPAAVISDAYWARTFNRDRAVVGRTMLVESVPVPIVGITPPGFDGAIVGSSANIMLAIGVRAQLQPERAGFVTAGARWLRILARPKPGVSRDQVKARLRVVWAEAIAASLSPTASPEARQRALASTLDVINGRSGSSSLRAQFRQPLFVLMGVVGLVLAIACANVANLLLARAAVRQREISVRLAMGAGRIRLVRQLLTESALLACAGAALGVFFASLGGRLLLDLMSTAVTDSDQSLIALDVGLNWRVMAFTTLIALSTTFLFGLAPAFRATTISPAASINAGSTRIAGGRGRLGAALVTTQVAISLVLLIGAGLFVRTLQNLRTLDTGFRHQGVLLVSIDARRAVFQGSSTADLSSARARLRAFNEQALEFAARLPGVKVATMSAVTPLMGGGISMLIAVNGQQVQGDIGGREFHFNLVGPRYFEALATPVLLGREFTARDDETSQPVAIVNESFVRKHMADVNPLGQQVSVVGAAERQVVGVVRDAVYETLRQTPPPTVYVPIAQSAPQPIKLVIVADGSLAQIAAAIRKELQPRLAGYPVTSYTLTDELEKNLAQERLMATLAAIFGALALTLAVVGLYGLLTYTVVQRTGEIGIRLALGAARPRVLTFVMTDALRTLALGVAIGILAGWAALRVISSMLFGLSPNDPATTAAAILVLLAAGLVAGFVPAFRASNVDPLIALRTE